ncbi:hypothetical protein PF005_g33664 [Phytophthora fragariae]|uniref:Secreted protein n=1 Tax=Phytophthora fragariae TaxID=53985 RepID=A0A6A3PC87_9STRA|nr:hypothetical protein PF003_g23649 [Phytophthora fragariae]KAE8916242.1 hypothetical protein PF009_g33432 [Phytophthora fragariae]KAE8950999.1 hypothetical protein PF011_g33077 [Phytophthora fragariae]KAE9053085.1 hypothetical protein PF007_g33046 [Phytophthora fragariae]KAE9053510.1 hypothetical protein PF006_g33536 [Phytophthora fragariae]
MLACFVLSRLAMEALAIKKNNLGARRPAMIYPGDTIKCFSPALVAVDARALRTAVVLEVDHSMICIQSESTFSRFYHCSQLLLSQH